MRPDVEALRLSGSEKCYQFSVAAEWRRVLLLASVGCVSLAIVAWIVDEQVVHRGFAYRLTTVGILSGLVCWFAHLLLPCIKVDQVGISRRVLWWWDSWSWDSFEEGQIHPGFEQHSFERRESPWWYRKLQLGYLEEDDIRTIEQLIAVVWKPLAVPVPESILVKIQWPDGRRVFLNKNGLRISSQQSETHYRWESVLGIEVWRIKHGRRDFRELLIRLLDQEVKLRQWNHQGQRCHNWIGIEAELIASYLSQHIDVSRWQDFSMTGEPKSLSELDSREVRQERLFQESNRVSAWCLSIMWGLILSMPLWIPWPTCLAMSGMIFLLSLVPAYLIRRSIHSENAKSLRELQAMRAALVEREAQV